MRVIVITPPDPVVVWEELDAHLRLDGDETQRTYVESLIAAATALIDGPAGWLGRALGPQTLEARFDAFWEHRRHPGVQVRSCPGEIRLPFPPVIDIVSVKYIDLSGVEQTISSSAYELRGCELAPVYGTSWPMPRWQPEAVRVQFRAGYAEDLTADPLVPAVPAPVSAAIKLMVGDLYANRETVLDARANAAVAIPMSTTVEALLAPYRIYG